MAKLKVYRTPIGFHDAYVAAPSQKAALKAWGADADLFARGVAEVVTDGDLTAEPLARPGEVVKRLRGSAAEQLAAAPPVRREQAKGESTKRAPAVPKPDRATVEATEQALAKAENSHREEERALAAEEVALAGRRRLLRAEWIATRDRLEGERDAAEERYAAALTRWRAGS